MREWLVESGLHRIERIDADARAIDLFLVAGSFEPRSVRATTLLQKGACKNAIVFQYQDTLDTAIGQDNARQIQNELRRACISPVDVLPCQFADPYSAVRTFHVFLEEKGLKQRVRTVLMDITCFTKLHMLLLLKYLEMEVGADTISVVYTEPLAYATAFGKALSYGIDRAVYVPYSPGAYRSRSIGLIAFLGHERQRLECIIQELEPDVSVIVLGEPGFTRDMMEDSRRINDSLLHRSTYDRQYRLATVSANNLEDAAQCVERELDRIVGEGCESVYLAPLGTKVQALAIDRLRRSRVSVRMLLAYSIPKRYERRLYSQGSGPTYAGLVFRREADTLESSNPGGGC